MNVEGVNKDWRERTTPHYQEGIVSYRTIDYQHWSDPRIVSLVTGTGIYWLLKVGHQLCFVRQSCRQGLGELSGFVGSA